MVAACPVRGAPCLGNLSVAVALARAVVPAVHHPSYKPVVGRDSMADNSTKRDASDGEGFSASMYRVPYDQFLCDLYAVDAVPVARVVVL